MAQIKSWTVSDGLWSRIGLPVPERKRESHEYQLYLAVENIDHTRTKAKSPRTNGICERFHRTIQEEFYA